MKEHQNLELGTVRKGERVQVVGKVRLARHDEALVDVKHGNGLGQVKGACSIETVATHCQPGRHAGRMIPIPWPLCDQLDLMGRCGRVGQQQQYEEHLFFSLYTVITPHVGCQRDETPPFYFIQIRTLYLSALRFTPKVTMAKRGQKQLIEFSVKHCLTQV